MSKTKLRDRWYIRDKFVRNVLGLILVGSIGFLLFGAYYDFKGFADAILGGIVIGGFTVLLGLFIVDKLIEHRQEEQWAKVRLSTYRGLGQHLCDIVAQVFVVFSLDKSNRATGTNARGT
jgi:hypothetical protein